MTKTTISADAASVGKRIAAAIEQSGKDIKTVAASLNVTSDAVFKWQRGEGVETWVKLARLAEALGTTPNALLGVDVGLGDEFLAELLVEGFSGVGVHRDQARNLVSILLEFVRRPVSPRERENTKSAARSELAGAIRIIGSPRR